ncbi:MAG: aldo/keto reductase [Clostridia bacterium]|nr:aldo/keto reductase [Clostridia bacterium]
MQYLPLGKTGIKVSKLCFGSLTVGPCQADLSPDAAGEVIAFALSLGINHIDTAQLYETYPHIKRGLELAGNPDGTVISSKTYAYTKQMALDAVDEARRGLSRDVIDIFLLHEQESEHTLRGHMEALETLYDLKARGIIRAVGLSTHRISGVSAAIKYGLDVVHPLLNKFGVGIGDGTAAGMEAEVARAADEGIGIFVMKPFGGGNLLAHTSECMAYACSLPYSFAVGMRSADEVSANVAFAETGKFPPELALRISSRKRRLIIEDHCIGCGACAEVCGQAAISVVNGKAECAEEKCITCGYCGRACPETCLKIV